MGGGAFGALVARDVSLAVREGGSVTTALGFYLIVVALMPLGLGPDLVLLSRIAPAILWIALLLAALLSTARLFEVDAEDGSLDVMAAAPLSLEAVAVAKMLAHWLSIALPLVIAAPVLGLLLALDLAAVPMLVATAITGTPAVSAIGTLGGALTLKARRGGLLIALIVLPFYIPTLIFGILAVTAAVSGPPGSAIAPFAMLAAISLAAVVLTPWATAAALRAQVA
jgi:heme exporter protein B